MDTKNLRRFLQLIKPALICSRGKITEFFLFSLAVIKDLNVLLNILHRLLPGLVSPVKGQLGFQGAPEAFHGGVIITIAPAAHGGLHLEPLQKLTVLL